MIKNYVQNIRKVMKDLYILNMALCMKLVYYIT